MSAPARDSLGLSKAQWAAIHALEADGWAISYLRQQVASDPVFHLYRDEVNRHVEIDDDGDTRWLDVVEDLQQQHDKDDEADQVSDQH